MKSALINDRFRLIYILSFLLFILGLTVCAIVYEHNNSEKAKKEYQEMIQKEHKKLKTIEFTNKLLDKK